MYLCAFCERKAIQSVLKLNVHCLSDISGDSAASWYRNTVAGARLLLFGITDFEFVMLWPWCEPRMSWHTA